MGTVINHKIANASFFAAMMVAAIHTAGVMGRPLNSISEGSAFWWFEAFGHWGVFSVAVPFFFVSSGYFLAKHFGEYGWWWRECKKRVNSLLVPYILWSAIFALLSFAAFFAANFLNGRIAFPFVDLSFRFWVQTFGLSPFSYPALPLFWYLRTLFLFVLVCPILRYLIKTCGCWFIVAVYSSAFLVIVGLWTYPVNKVVEFFCYCFKLEGLVYFCIGLVLRMDNGLCHIGTICQTRKYLAWCMLGISLLLVVVSSLATRWMGKNFMHLGSVVFTPPLLFAFWHFIPSNPFPKWLTRNTFAIFMMHGIVLRAMEIGFHWKVSTMPQWGAKWTVAFVLPVFVAMLLRRFLPGVASVLFGGR